jgi:hypothetical protein
MPVVMPALRAAERRRESFDLFLFTSFRQLEVFASGAETPRARYGIVSGASNAITAEIQAYAAKRRASARPTSDWRGGSAPARPHV